MPTDPLPQSSIPSNRGYVFDRDPNITRLLMGSKSQLKTYLDNNGGVRIYRDGVRVYDYGEKGNDWLDLDLRRVNRPATRISNNIVVGAIFLNREDSEDLVEKTNREGFVEKAAYHLLRKFPQIHRGNLVGDNQKI